MSTIKVLQIHSCQECLLSCLRMVTVCFGHCYQYDSTDGCRCRSNSACCVHQAMKSPDISSHSSSFFHPPIHPLFPPPTPHRHPPPLYHHHTIPHHQPACASYASEYGEYARHLDCLSCRSLFGHHWRLLVPSRLTGLLDLVSKTLLQLLQFLLLKSPHPLLTPLNSSPPLRTAVSPPPPTTCLRMQ